MAAKVKLRTLRRILRELRRLFHPKFEGFFKDTNVRTNINCIFGVDEISFENYSFAKMGRFTGSKVKEGLINESPTRQLFGYSYLLSEYRRMHAADQVVAHFMSKNAENFLCLLQSERIKEELYEFYKGSGESKVKDVARRVGFETPSTNEDDSKK